MEAEWKFNGCLFDLDGTLIDSLGAAERAWTQISQRNGLDTDYVMSVIHGRPAIESLNEVLAGKSKELIQRELDWLVQFESNDTSDIVAINGSVAFLKQLNALGVPWAIVTSGSYPVAMARFNAAKLPEPAFFVTVKDITQGKPHPEPYLLGAERLGLDTSACLVFEDAPSGVKSGLDAGSPVVGIFSQYSSGELFNIQGMDNFDQAKVIKEKNGFKLTIIV